MRNRRGPSIAFLALGLLTLGACQSRSDQPTERVQRLIGGAEQVALIQSPDSVKTWRLAHDRPDLSETRSDPPVTLTDAQAATLADLVLDDASYVWEASKGCDPIPGVLVIFEKDGRTAEVRICYECAMIGFTPGRWEDFDDVAPEFIAWAKRVFPDDHEIQDL